MKSLTLVFFYDRVGLSDGRVETKNPDNRVKNRDFLITSWIWDAWLNERFLDNKVQIGYSLWLG